MDRRHFAHLSVLALANMQVRVSGQTTAKVDFLETRFSAITG
jgi:hypothetical protein